MVKVTREVRIRLTDGDHVNRDSQREGDCKPCPSGERRTGPRSWEYARIGAQGVRCACRGLWGTSIPDIRQVRDRFGPVLESSYDVSPESPDQPHGSRGPPIGSPDSEPTE